MVLNFELFPQYFVSIAIGCAMILFFLRNKYSYWKRKNVPFMSPSLPFGNIENPFSRTKSTGLNALDFYLHFKSINARHGGVYKYFYPMYVPVDPEIIKSIISKDFEHFVDRGFFYNDKDDPLSGHLFLIGGRKWKKLRVKLTPTFTSGKMKMMFPTVVECAEKLISKVDKLENENQTVNVKHMMTRYTIDVIGSCAFGLECKTFESEDSDFSKFGRRAFWRTKFESFKTTLCDVADEFSRSMRISAIPECVSSFFVGVVRDSVQYREKNNVQRRDFLQLLLEMKNNSSKEGENFTFEEIAAQAFVFFIAGFETSSTLMTFCLYELSKNEDIQEKVRKEIEEVVSKFDGKITYDGLMQMTYMQQVIDETLRKYPPVPTLNRRCTKEYSIPGTDLVIEKGTDVLISVLGLQNDPDHFPNPEKFDPDRFNEENKRNITPYTYLPFGEGPRVCIGLRFGVMQAKIGLTMLLKQFKFDLNHKTTEPVEIDPYVFTYCVKSKILLNVSAV